jgi:nucleotide-binding universal stress UspA family protein
MHTMRILVAVDGSPGAWQALRHVAGLARGGLRLVAVLAHVQESPGPMELLRASDPLAVGRAGLAAGEHRVSEAGEMLDGEGVAWEGVARVADGDPAHALLDVASEQRCAAIVVGAHRRGLLRHVLLGSIARTLVAESPLPVTVVREGAGNAHVSRESSDSSDAGATGSAGGRARDDTGPGHDGPSDGVGGGDGGGGGGGGGD